MTSFAYPLKHLSDDDSWITLKQKAFANGGAIETSDLVVIGREIMKKCRGMPLAIKVVGGRENHRRSQNANLLMKSHSNALQFHWSGKERENTNEVVSEEGNTDSNNWAPYLSQVFHIEGLTNVKRIGAEFYGHKAEVATSSGKGISAGGAMFPALRNLHLVELDGLEQWLEALHPSPFVKVFPCLEELELTGLYKLSMVLAMEMEQMGRRAERAEELAILRQVDEFASTGLSLPRGKSGFARGTPKTETFADNMSGPLSPISAPAQKQLKYTAGIANGSVRESAAFMDQTRKMVPIGQLSMKKLALVGHGGKLWRWKRSHHQWLLQFKWKWQKPWRLSELIRHSDETVMRARPRPQALPNGVCKGILSKVLPLVANEANLARGFKGELKRLAETLKMIQDLLSDAESKELTLSSVKTWLKSLKAVAYDADTVLDEFSYELLRRQVAVRDQIQYKMAHKIKAINLSLDDIYNEAKEIGLKAVDLINSSAGAGRQEVLATHPGLGDSEEIVGRAAD
ncbi:hypothetical protein RJ640_001176, partial [Escallonia rubra]